MGRGDSRPVPVLSDSKLGLVPWPSSCYAETLRVLRRTGTPILSTVLGGLCLVMGPLWSCTSPFHTGPLGSAVALGLLTPAGLGLPLGSRWWSLKLFSFTSSVSPGMATAVAL